MSWLFAHAAGLNPIEMALEEPKDKALHWHFFEKGGLFSEGLGIHLPHEPVFGFFQVTKFKILLLIAAVIVAVSAIYLSRSIKGGRLPKGKYANFLEVLLLYVRDNIARPNLGDQADRFLPFLWTTFLFILTCNLLGMIPAPLGGSPTASIAVTAGLALVSCIAINFNGIRANGVVGYVKGFWMPIDLKGGVIVSLILFVIEFLGVFVRSAVLAIRLFANMYGGHVALAVLLSFIITAAKVGQENGYLWWLHPVVSFGAVAICIALSCLELFVAFLQAFVFTLLTALFMGMATHAGHGHDDHGEGHDDHALADHAQPASAH